MVAFGRTVPNPTGSAGSAVPVAQVQNGAQGKTRSRYWTWAALMHRAFDLDVLACPRCGGRMRLIATTHDPAVIRRILAHLRLAHSGQSPGNATPEPSAAAP